MRFVDEFRDPYLIRQAAREIRSLTDPGRHYRIMEICGGHTHSIYRFALADLLPANVEMVHGPGCPVCVLPMARVDEGLALAEDPAVILAAFGDMMRVPGRRGSPLEHQARGADVRMVYSPLDALKLAQRHPDRQVVFFAIGFETTAPATALTLTRARELGVTNFTVFCNHVMVVPAIRAILESPGMRLDAFIGPGHVSTVIGCGAYELVARDHGRPLVVSGFEPLDLLQSMAMVLRQLRDGRAEIECQYARAVPWEGNPAAFRAMDEVFEPRPTFEWRGLGFIPESALRIRPRYADWDAEVRFGMPAIRVTEAAEAACCELPYCEPCHQMSAGDVALSEIPFSDVQCGEVLKGALHPHQCKLFGEACTPERPIGALMVSSEGACAAYFNYVHRRAAAAQA